jgi:hypothetical protein
MGIVIDASKSGTPNFSYILPNGVVTKVFVVAWSQELEIKLMVPT